MKRILSSILIVTRKLIHLLKPILNLTMIVTRKLNHFLTLTRN